MNRREVMGATLLLTLVELLDEGARNPVAASPNFRLPITIDDGDGPIRPYGIRATYTEPLVDSLMRLARRTNRVVVVGSNPTWEHPEELAGQQLLQIGSYRNADMPPIPDYPAEIQPGKYWMIFFGPTRRPEGRRRTRPVRPTEIDDSRFLILGPTTSVSSYQLHPFAVGNRWCAPQVYCKYTNPEPYQP